MDIKETETDFDTGGMVDMDDTEIRQSVYEIGYHVLPTLSEEELPKVVSAFMDALKAEKADFVGDRFPSKIELAFPMAKRTNSKRANYNSAYFGWVAFEMPREGITRVKEVLDSNEHILRYLIVTTDRDAVAAAMSGAVAPIAPTPTGTIDKPKRAEETGGELSEADLDEALKDIATEDAKVVE